MNISGIIVEYNPFHNGHLYHLNKTRELTNPDLIIAITSGNFTQRGEISIINKFDKTKAALEHGVDLVVELPYIYTLQNSSVFGKRSVELLNKLGINNLVFGSETNNLEELKDFASYNIEIDYLKEIMDKGNSFPKAYGLLAGSLYPNDILGISYLRALEDTNIKPYLIQRTNSYHSDQLEEIASAKAIRLAIKDNKDYYMATPIDIKEPLFNDDLYPYLQRILLTSDKKRLEEIFLVSEGIENLLIKNAYENDAYEDFIKASISRRYTRARIQRICMNVINNITKEEYKALEPLNYVRVLGFNSKGREYLKQFRDREDFKVVTQFKNIPESYKNIEWKVANVYATYTSDRKVYLKQELRGPIIID